MEYPYFDVETARELLPWLRDTLKKLREMKVEVEKNMVGGDRVLVLRYSMEIDRSLREIVSKGVVIRDLDKGLVDFPAVVNGRPAYLCWLIDEEDVSHWHYAEDGFKGRRRLTGEEEVLSLR
ncbi:hypothetical protein HS1genome_2188 [Sulfodiicoccus acidiphilus]|uniref:DUF2203 domain-containing protein n=1 Tax=Sulfodiicoccus acidiphilus TaxID=1670455 RepID=A0A348B6J7_9CREN|nr:DUF2203 family protein [Sulfodiicoccus acidiphilus]BBD73799.1 hypothetical protein HS1genome_2188 [Sulfodiicoccus acidiphilus]GGU03644.1 hypothetical protein GCM10007116_20630 [Sulfodiicoccus acidiphilus]